MSIRMLVKQVSMLALAALLAAGFASFSTLVSNVPASALDATSVTVDGTEYTTSTATQCSALNVGTRCISVDFASGGPTTLTIMSTGNVFVDGIAAQGDLRINAIGVNLINTPSASTKAIDVTGNLTIVGTNSGSPASIGEVNIDAGSGNTAINVGGVFTVGEVGNAVKVAVQSGVAPAENSVTPATGSSYTVSNGGGQTGSCTPTFPASITVDGTNILTGSVPGVKAEFIGEVDLGGFWSISFDPSVDGGNFGAIEIAGSITPFLSTASPGTVTIAASNDLSVNATGCAGVLFIGEGSVFMLEGGIYSDNDSPQGAVKVDSAVVQVGTSETRSMRGIESPTLDVYNPGATLTIYTAAPLTRGLAPAATPSALSGISGSPNLPMTVSLSQGANLTVDTTGTATTNMKSVTVSRAAVFDVTHGSGIVDGTPFELFSEVLPTNSGQVCLDPTRVPQPSITSVGFSDDVVIEKDKAKLVTTASTFVFSSLSSVTRNFEWLEGSSGDAVTGGAVCVLASQGTARVDDGPFGVFYTFEIEENSPVTIKLLPQHEFQFLSGEFEASGPPQPLANGIFGAAVATIPVNPEAGAAEYSFTMPLGNIALSTVFEAVPDAPATISGTTAIDSANVTDILGSINGNAVLTVEGANPTNTNEFESAAGTRTVANYLDVTLGQVIQQGSTTGTWDSTITTTAEPIGVSMQLDTALQGFSDYQVIRDHNGVVETIPTTYDATTGTITFETDAFSTYAIAHGPKVVNPNTYDEGSDWQIAGMIGSLAGLIVIASTYLIRRRYPIG